MICWLIGRLDALFMRLSVYSLIGWLVDMLIGAFVDWLVALLDG